jgi:hypothetical protein
VHTKPDFCVLLVEGRALSLDTKCGLGDTLVVTVENRRCHWGLYIPPTHPLPILGASK